MNMPKRPSGISQEEKIELTQDPISPNSRKVYVNGTVHPDLRVPFREIKLAPTKVHNPQPGEPEAVPNDPVLVYDTSGPYTDPDVRRPVGIWQRVLETTVPSH